MSSESETTTESPNDELDSPWKDLLDTFFKECLEFFFPAVYELVDWSQPCVPLEQELREFLPDSRFGKAEVDKLVRVRYRDGREAELYLHVEVQNQPLAEFAARMFRYYYRILDHYGRHPVSLAILGDRSKRWKPSSFKHQEAGCKLRFDFPVVKLLDYQNQVDLLEKSSNPFALVVLGQLATLATKKDPSARRDEKIRLVRRLFESGMSKRDIRNLFAFLDGVLKLPKKLEGEFRQDLLRLEQETKMPYLTKYERRALNKGLMKGRNEGRDEEARKSLQLILENRFGVPGVELFSRTEKIELAGIRQLFAKAASMAPLAEIQVLLDQLSGRE